MSGTRPPEHVVRCPEGGGGEQSWLAAGSPCYREVLLAPTRLSRAHPPRLNEPRLGAHRRELEGRWFAPGTPPARSARDAC